MSIKKFASSFGTVDIARYQTDIFGFVFFTVLHTTPLVMNGKREHSLWRSREELGG